MIFLDIEWVLGYFHELICDLQHTEELIKSGHQRPEKSGRNNEVAALTSWLRFHFSPAWVENIWHLFLE